MSPANSKVEIRRAIRADVSEIAQIYNQAIASTTATFDTEPKTVAQQLDWYDSHDSRHPVFVATVEGRVVGWSSLTPWSDRPAYRDTAETSFYVAESHRGQGIGRQLKLASIEDARRQGFRTLIARVVSTSLSSLHLNRSFGFREVGVLHEVGFKFGQWLDVVILQLMLTDETTTSPLAPQTDGSHSD